MLPIGIVGRRWPPGPPGRGRRRARAGSNRRAPAGRRFPRARSAPSGRRSPGSRSGPSARSAPRSGRARRARGAPRSGRPRGPRGARGSRRPGARGREGVRARRRTRPAMISSPSQSSSCRDQAARRGVRVPHPLPASCRAFRSLPGLQTPHRPGPQVTGPAHPTASGEPVLQILLARAHDSRTPVARLGAHGRKPSTRLPQRARTPRACAPRARGVVAFTPYRDENPPHPCPGGHRRRPRARGVVAFAPYRDENPPHPCPGGHRRRRRARGVAAFTPYRDENPPHPCPGVAVQSSGSPGGCGQRRAGSAPPVWWAAWSSRR